MSNNHQSRGAKTFGSMEVGTICRVTSNHNWSHSFKTGEIIKLLRIKEGVYYEFQNEHNLIQTLTRECFEVVEEESYEVIGNSNALHGTLHFFKIGTIVKRTGKMGKCREELYEYVDKWGCKQVLEHHHVKKINSKKMEKYAVKVKNNTERDVVFSLYEKLGFTKKAFNLNNIEPISEKEAYYAVNIGSNGKDGMNAYTSTKDYWTDRGYRIADLSSLIKIVEQRENLIVAGYKPKFYPKYVEIGCKTVPNETVREVYRKLID